MPRRTAQEQAELVARLLENASDVIAVIDTQGTISFHSPSVARVLGYRADELEGTSVFDLVHPDDLPGAWTRMSQVQEAPGPTRKSLIRLRHRDGSWRTFEAVGTAMFDDPLVGGIVVNAWDVTEQRELERQLLEGQKLQAVGRLAAGVAHDFNNLFTVIEGHSALLLEGLDEGDPRRADVAAIAEASGRAAQLTRRLLAFNRGDDGVPKVLELNEIVAGVAATIRPLITEAIELDVVLDPSAGDVKCDPAELEQVILNLVLNARDALDERGRIAICTSRVTLEPSDAHVIPVPPGTYACLAVADTGSGMDADTRERMFEPFFTTKELGMGTGLGLSTVRRIVAESGGTITIESGQEQGSTFSIYLPVARESAVPDELAPDDVPAAHEATVLVVEDDDLVRSLTQRLLEAAGYDVLGARSGAEALDLVRTQGDRIDLLLTDVVMPGIHGPELARESQKLQPGLATLFTSGFSDEAAADYVGAEVGHLLPKPFSPEALVDAVRQVLAERTAAP